MVGGVDGWTPLVKHVFLNYLNYAGSTVQPVVVTHHSSPDLLTYHTLLVSTPHVQLEIYLHTTAQSIINVTC